MTRIIFLTNALVIGGAERVFCLEAEMLHAHGYDVHMILLFRRGELPLNIPPDRVHVIGLSSIFDVRGLIRLRGVLASLRPAVIYSTLNEANFLARTATIFMSHMRIITREANMADVKPRIYRWGDIILGWRSARIIGVSDAVRASVIAYAPYVNRRSAFLYNPVHIPTQVAHGMRNTDLKLLTVGTLTPKKDHAVLVRAMQFMPDNTYLTIIGDGRERQMLEQLSKEIGVSRHVSFEGSVAPERVGAFYRDADIFVLPSSREGCPNVVLEALSYQLPVVAFDIPGMAEFVRPEWGALVRTRDPHALADAITQLAASRELRDRMGEAGLQHVRKEHDVGVHMTRLEALLNAPSRT